MWRLLIIILAIIGWIVAWAGEPIGIIGFLPISATLIWEDINEPKHKKKHCSYENPKNP